MKKHKQCQDKDCGVLFTLCPQVFGQTYCSRKVCQQARKKEWNRKRLPLIRTTLITGKTTMLATQITRRRIEIDKKSEIITDQNTRLLQK